MRNVNIKKVEHNYINLIIRLIINLPNMFDQIIFYLYTTKYNNC